MKRFIWVIFLVLSLPNIVNAQHNWRNNKIKKDNGVISNKSILPNAVLSINRDTIPLGRYKYFEIDEVRYKKYLFTNVTNDSVKLLIANAEDWSEFSKAHDSLNDILRENKYNNVNNYTDVQLLIKKNENDKQK